MKIQSAVTLLQFAQPVFMLFVVCITLYSLGVEAVPLPDGNTTAVGVSGGGVCTNKALLESLKVIVSESTLGRAPWGHPCICSHLMSADSQLEVRGHLWPLLDPGGVWPRPCLLCDGGSVLWRGSVDASSQHQHQLQVSSGTRESH